MLASMTTTPTEKPRYANALAMHFAAAINGLYRFEREKSAHAKLEAITLGCVLTKDQPEEGVALWIRDFALTQAQEEAGYLGNFAVIRVVRMADEDGYYTLDVTAVDKELRYHPLRKRIAQRSPNWGHPLLRAVKAAKQYGTLEEVEALLQQLHLEYPETTVPAANKLYLMIFSREETPEKPLQKYVLEIENLQGGGFTIVARKNEYKAKPKVKRVGDVSTPGISATPTGHFASMVALKRKRKPVHKPKSETN